MTSQDIDQTIEQRERRGIPQTTPHGFSIPQPPRCKDCGAVLVDVETRRSELCDNCLFNRL